MKLYAGRQFMQVMNAREEMIFMRQDVYLRIRERFL